MLELWTMYKDVKNSRRSCGDQDGKRSLYWASAGWPVAALCLADTSSAVSIVGIRVLSACIGGVGVLVVI